MIKTQLFFRKYTSVPRDSLRVSSIFSLWALILWLNSSYFFFGYFFQLINAISLYSNISLAYIFLFDYDINFFFAARHVVFIVICVVAIGLILTSSSFSISSSVILLKNNLFGAIHLSVSFYLKIIFNRKGVALV